MKGFYEKHHKWLLVIPILLLVLAITQITLQMSSTGDFVNKGISLKGGSTITIYRSDVDENSLSNYLSNTFPQSELSVRTLTAAGQKKGIIIDSDAQNTDEIEGLLSAIGTQITNFQKDDYSTDITGPSIGQSFFKETIKALIIAFVLMAITVFLYFRTAIPAGAVVLAAFSDIIITLAIFNLTGIKLSTAGIAAFLMLIGYSVDTNILLTSKVVKSREGSIMERIFIAMKTGLTMTFTTLSVITLTLIFTQSEIIQQIMIIVLIGLVVDMINTWIQNVVILRWYAERNKL